ncbi:unnamed protein product [Colias eurytheme]|nr:unnamed protein product [Colias eurytheme]
MEEAGLVPGPGFRRWPYWWSEELTMLREKRIRKRRVYTRLRRRKRRDEELEKQSYLEYRAAEMEYKIAREKIKAEKDLALGISESQQQVSTIR